MNEPVIKFLIENKHVINLTALAVDIGMSPYVLKNILYERMHDKKYLPLIKNYFLRKKEEFLSLNREMDQNLPQGLPHI